MVNLLNDQPPAGGEADRNPVGDHIALIYDSPEERVSAVTPLIRVGLEKGELCLYISNEENDTGLVDALRAENIDVEKAIGNGGLILTHKQEMYFKQGFFDPEWTLKVIGNIADLAKSYGFTAMRIISDMRWVHDKVAGAQKWPEYEAKLNVLNPGISLRIICQYDRAAFSPSSLIIALHAHPKVVSGGLVNKNQFYVPTDQLLQGDYSELELQRMLDSIHLHNSTEADLLSRDQVLEEMRHKVGEALAAKKAVEDELNEQIARFNDLAERSSDWCWELDENGVYTWSSARVKDILGMVPEDIVGRTPLDLVSRDETDRIAKLLTKTMAAHVPITALEKEVRHKDGHTVFLEMSGMPQFGPDGRFLGYRGIDRDITGRKAAKQAIEDSRKRIEDSLAQIHERDLRIEALEVAMAQLKAVQSERDAAVQSVKESLRSSQAELNRTKEELGRVRDALGLREDELALARTAAEAKQEELDEYKASLTLLRQNLEDKEAELLSSQRELTEVQTLLKEKERELEELSASFRSQTLELGGLRGSMSGLEEDNSRKAEELITLRQQVERLNTDLRTTEEGLASKISELDQAHEEAKRSQETIDLRTKEVAEVREENARLKEELEGRNRSLTEMGSLLDEARSEVTSLTEQVERLRESNDRLEGEREQLVWAREQLEDLTRVKDRELEELRAVMDQTVRDLRVKEEELSSIKNELGAQVAKVNELAAQLQRLDADQNVNLTIINGLREALDQRDGWLFAAKAESEHWSSTVRTVMADKNRVYQDMDRALSKLQFATMELERKSAELTMERDQHRLSKDELALRLSELTELRGQYQSSKEELERKVQDLVQERDRYQLVAQQHDEKVQVVSALTGELEAARDEIAAVRDDHQRTMDDLQQRMEELTLAREELVKARCELASLTEERDNAIEELKGKAMELSSATEELGATKAELVQLQDQQRSWADQLEMRGREGASLAAQVEAARTEIAQLKLENERSVQELHGKNAEVADLTIQLETIREELAQVRGQQASTVEELERTRNELKSSYEENRRLAEVREQEQGRALDLERKAEEVDVLRGQLMATQNELAVVREGQVRTQQTVDGLTRELESTKAVLGTKEASLMEALSALDTLKGTLTSRVTELNDRTVELEARQQAVVKANEELARLQEELGTKASAIEAARSASAKEATRLRAVLNSMPTALALLSPEGKVVGSNTALHEITGMSDIEGRSAADIWPGLDLDKELSLAPIKGDARVEVHVTTVPDPEGGEGKVLTFAHPSVHTTSLGSMASPVESRIPPRSDSYALEDPLTVIMGSVSLAKEYVIPEGRMYGKLTQIEEATNAARHRLLGPTAPEAGTSKLVRGKGRVLLLDDDEGVLEATGDLLQHLGYNVEVARDGDEALVRCQEAVSRRQPFEVAVLDLVSTEGMTGPQVAERLRSACPQIKLVATGPACALPPPEHLTTQGFSASLSKPYPADQLSRLLAEVLRG